MNEILLFRRGLGKINCRFELEQISLLQSSYVAVKRFKQTKQEQILKLWCPVLFTPT